MSNAPGQNALQHETSPYLLQHADNPVQWYAWGEEALSKARLEQKPILLSIGYSACHWCHVMAHESFEDEETAAIMNRHFINIKVDREERPDIDRIYQTAQHMLTQKQGGWPLTMFLTPDDHIPFFGGTYFPKESRFGLPDFKGLLLRIDEFYKNKIEDIRQQNESFRLALQQLEQQPSVDADELTINDLPLQLAYQQMLQTFDRSYGGFGSAPKFPHPSNLEQLFIYSDHTSSSEQKETAMEMALFSLEQMAKGGIYDHIGGGFARYSVDQYWMIPHFEKMLYDNGPLLYLYSNAWQRSENDLFKQIVTETADWVLREMQSPEGGYYSSLDADSEGEEGKFYVWTQEEVRSLLNEEEYDILAYQYGLDSHANFEGEWHLYLRHPPEETTAYFSLDKNECQSKLAVARGKLFQAREQRIRPGRDDKILGSWNALMIKGMAYAGQTFNKPDYIESATTALEFIRTSLWKDHRLLATCKDGKAHLNAYLDDYAFLLDATLQLLQSRFDQQHLSFAIELADALLDHFQDNEHGGFYFTSHDHEQLIQRNKPFMDDALSSGNGVAARALLQLGHLVGDTRYLDAAEHTLKSAWHSINRIPSAHNALLLALDEYLQPSRQIIFRGEIEEIRHWKAEMLQVHTDLNQYLYFIPDDIKNLPGLLAKQAVTEKVSAHVCIGKHCLAPFTELNKLLDYLKSAESE